MIDHFCTVLIYSSEHHSPAMTGHPTRDAHIAALRRLIDDGGAYVHLVLFDPAAYLAWRMRQSRADTRRARQEWANEQVRCGRA